MSYIRSLPHAMRRKVRTLINAEHVGKWGAFRAGDTYHRTHLSVSSLKLWRSCHRIIHFFPFINGMCIANVLYQVPGYHVMVHPSYQVMSLDVMVHPWSS